MQVLAIVASVMLGLVCVVYGFNAVGKKDYMGLVVAATAIGLLLAFWFGWPPR